LADVVTDGLPI